MRNSLFYQRLRALQEREEQQNRSNIEKKIQQTLSAFTAQTELKQMNDIGTSPFTSFLQPDSQHNAKAALNESIERNFDKLGQNPMFAEHSVRSNLRPLCHPLESADLSDYVEGTGEVIGDSINL